MHKRGEYVHVKGRGIGLIERVVSIGNPPRDNYVIGLKSQSVTVFCPVDSLLIRGLVSPEIANVVQEILTDNSAMAYFRRDTWISRFKAWHNAVQTGNLIQIAMVFKDLCNVPDKSADERALMLQLNVMLSDELSLVTGINFYDNKNWYTGVKSLDDNDGSNPDGDGPDAA